MSRRVAIGFALLLSAAFTGACSGAPDDALGEDSAAKKVKPQGSQTAGKLKVVLPANATLPALTGTWSTTPTMRVELFATQGGKTTPFAIGEEVPLAPGSVCLRLRVATLQQSFDGRDEEAFADGATDCSVVVTANQVYTYALAVLDYAASESVVGIGNIFGRYARYATNRPPGPRCDRTKATAQDESWLMSCAAEPDTKRPALPGTYNYQWGIADGFSVRVLPGDVKTIDFADTTLRRVTRVAAPARENKDASGTTQYEVAGGGKRFAQERPATTIQVGHMTGVADVPHTLTIVSAAAAQTISLSLPSSPNAPLRFEVGRIDVDGVTMSGGGPSEVAGTYVVERQDSANSGAWTPLVLAPQGWPTGTGLDVLAGVFRVTTTYVRLDGTKGSDVQTITIP